MQTICDDLAAEVRSLDAIVAELPTSSWALATPAIGWSIQDQISHLWFFDERALLAMRDAEEFAADLERLLAAGGADASIVPGRTLPSQELLLRWRASNERLLAAARQVDPATRVPWYGPSMGARSFITARLMETWAHGQDIVDALGIEREPTARLRHVAHIAVRARPFSFIINALPVPDAGVHVALTAPDGSIWEWDGPAENSVSGTALDFCLVATQRRHLADSQLRISGPVATEWMQIAQAFAGEPGTGRAPGQFGA